MTDESTDQERSDDAAGEDTPSPAKAPPEEVAASGRRHSRATALAVALAVVVLAVAAVGYQEVIPITHVSRARLAHLVPTRPGVKEFDTKPAQAVEIPVARTGLGVLESAAKKSPDATGAYLAAWTGTSPSKVVETVAFLAPSADIAKRLEAQVVSTALSAKGLSSGSLNRLSTFTVPGVRGASGSLYASSAKTAEPSQLAVTVFRTGNVVTVTEALHPTDARADSETATATEYRTLHAATPGFSLRVVHRPLTATIVWAAGALLVASLVALSPKIVHRMRRRRQERREAEERARGSLVPGHRITKRQR